MKKNYLILAIATLSVSSAFAGGLMTNTNQSVHFLRNPALDASTEIDAVYANPAGLTFLSDGFHVSLSNQSAFQTRTITSTFAPFAYNGGSATKEYVGETAAPIIPSVQFAYKKDKLALSGSFAVTGGGGKAVFDNGLPSFEASISMLPASVSTMGVPTTAYSVDGYMEGSQYTFGVQLNGSYLFTEALSGALGVRLNMVNNAYVGHLTDIMINPNHPLINPTAAMMSASAFFTAAGSATYASATADKYLDCTQSGFGVTPIVSLHYRLDELNLAAKYEFKTVMDITNNTTVDNTGMYADGATTPNDIPAYLSVGAEYSLCDKWKVSGGVSPFL